MARAKRQEAEVSRSAILETAERHLAAGGPNAVKVQTVAAELGLTDAAIHYHFGNRHGLMQALLRHAGRNLKASLAAAIAEAQGAAPDLDRIVESLDDAYCRKGYARLALWLALEGHQPEGEGMYRPLAEALHKSHGRKTAFEDTQIAIALLNIFLIGDALAGEAIMAGVGLAKNPKARSRLKTVARDFFAARLSKRAPRRGRRPRPISNNMLR